MDTDREGTRPEKSERDRISFQAYLEGVKPKIDARIIHYIAKGSKEVPFDHHFETTLRHGKRMRAGLLMLIQETFGQEAGREMALDLASAVEIAHAASLIVDDMLDDDDTRHDMPALHLTTGYKVAILGTLGLLSYPYEIVSRYGEECVHGLARTNRAMVQGATMELKGVPSFGVGQSYDIIIENKTGVLFGLAARFGAVAAGCPSETTEQCSEFGLLTGKVMQIADDIADLGSLLNGKATGIYGSEAILLRRCLSQTGEGAEDLDHDIQEHLRPIGTARRKDIEDILNRYLESAIQDAVDAAQRLRLLRVEDRGDRDIPELTGIPTEIAAMVLNQGKVRASHGPC